MRQGLTSSYPLTQGILTHQLYGPTPGKWALSHQRPVVVGEPAQFGDDIIHLAA
jgi:hypothetical protein